MDIRALRTYLTSNSDRAPTTEKQISVFTEKTCASLFSRETARPGAAPHTPRCRYAHYASLLICRALSRLA